MRSRSAPATGPVGLRPRWARGRPHPRLGRPHRGHQGGQGRRPRRQPHHTGRRRRPTAQGGTTTVGVDPGAFRRIALWPGVDVGSLAWDRLTAPTVPPLVLTGTRVTYHVEAPAFDVVTPAVRPAPTGLSWRCRWFAPTAPSTASPRRPAGQRRRRRRGGDGHLCRRLPDRRHRRAGTRLEGGGDRDREHLPDDHRRPTGGAGRRGTWRDTAVNDVAVPGAPPTEP